MSVLDYIFEKLKDDYAMVSLDYSIGSFATNIHLMCLLWLDRIYRHLIKNGFKFNENIFIVDNSPVYTHNRES
jgi:hypothetical protein